MRCFNARLSSSARVWSTCCCRSVTYSRSLTRRSRSRTRAVQLGRRLDGSDELRSAERCDERARCTELERPADRLEIVAPPRSPVSPVHRCRAGRRAGARLPRRDGDRRGSARPAPPRARADRVDGGHDGRGGCDPAGASAAARARRHRSRAGRRDRPGHVTGACAADRSALRVSPALAAGTKRRGGRLYLGQVPLTNGHRLGLSAGGDGDAPGRVVSGQAHVSPANYGQ